MGWGGMGRGQKPTSRGGEARGVDAHPLHRGGLVESEVASQNHHFRMLCIDRQDPEFHVQKVMPNDLFARILYELTSAPNLSQSEPCPSKPSQPSFYQSLPSKPCSQNLQSLALPCPSKPCPFKASFYQNLQSLALPFKCQCHHPSGTSRTRSAQDKVGRLLPQPTPKNRCDARSQSWRP